MKLGSGKKVQMVKGLHGFLRAIPGTHVVNSWTQRYRFVIPVLGKERQVGPWGSLTNKTNLPGDL